MSSDPLRASLRLTDEEDLLRYQGQFMRANSETSTAPEPFSLPLSLSLSQTSISSANPSTLMPYE